MRDALLGGSRSTSRMASRMASGEGANWCCVIVLLFITPPLYMLKQTASGGGFRDDRPKWQCVVPDPHLAPSEESLVASMSDDNANQPASVPDILDQPDNTNTHSLANDGAVLLGKSKNPDSCQLKPNAPIGYEVACVQAETQAACIMLEDNCVWAKRGSMPTHRYDHGEAKEVMSTFKWVMSFHVASYGCIVPFLVVLIASSEKRGQTAAASTLCMWSIAWIVSIIMLTVRLYGSAGRTCDDAEGQYAGDISELVHHGRLYCFYLFILPAVLCVCHGLSALCCDKTSIGDACCDCDIFDC